MKRVAIIGAGAAGLSAARHSLAAGHDVIIFEQTDQLGGTWVYRDEVGRDSNGQEVHTSMYKGLLWVDYVVIVFGSGIRHSCIVEVLCCGLPREW